MLKPYEFQKGHFLPPSGWIEQRHVSLNYANLTNDLTKKKTNKKTHKK